MKKKSELNINHDSESTSIRAGLVLSIILIILLVGSVYISQLIFQEISKSFNIDLIDARFVFSLSCFLYAISFFIYGPLSDKVATKTLLFFGCIGTIICLGISVIVDSYFYYLLVMSLIGFFAAAVPAALFAYTAKNTANDQLPKAMGVMISASIVGIIFSRSIVAMLTDYWSWQIAFIIYSAMIFCTTILVPFVIKEKSGAIKQVVSVKATYFTAVKLFLNKRVVLYLAIGFLLFFVYLGISSFLTFYLKGAPFYLSSAALGWLNFVGISAVIGAVISGNLTQFINKKNLLIIFLFGVSGSVLIIGYSGNLFGVAIGIFALFIFVFAIQTVVISLLNQSVNLNSRGAVSSLYLLSCLAGGSIGTYALGIIWNHLNWHGLIIICLVLTIINIFLALLTQKSMKE